MNGGLSIPTSHSASRKPLQKVAGGVPAFLHLRWGHTGRQKIRFAGVVQGPIVPVKPIGNFLPIKLFSLLVEALALTAMSLLLPLAPLACVLLSGRWHYLRQYRVTLVRSAHYLFALGQARVMSRNLQRRLGLHGYSAESIEGSCTHCGRCCVNRSCVFLGWHEDGGSQCTIYNNWFWKLTSCGSYPVDAQSIATYGCPSFKSVPIKVKVVPRRRIADRS